MQIRINSYLSQVNRAKYQEHSPYTREECACRSWPWKQLLLLHLRIQRCTQPRSRRSNLLLAYCRAGKCSLFSCFILSFCLPSVFKVMYLTYGIAYFFYILINIEYHISVSYRKLSRSN